jgi:integrase
MSYDHGDLPARCDRRELPRGIPRLLNAGEGTTIAHAGLLDRALDAQWDAIAAVSDRNIKLTFNINMRHVVIKQEKSIVQLESISFGTAKNHMRVWQLLYELSVAGSLSHDPLNFDPFIATSVQARAQSIGRVDDGRTNTIPPKQLLALVEGAAKWVLDFAEPIMKICAEAATYKRDRNSNHNIRAMWRKKVAESIKHFFPEDVPGNPVITPRWQYSSKISRSDGCLSLEDALYYLATACLILIGMFSARRSRELESLRVGATTVDNNGEVWLSSYIEKTLRDVDSLPVPASVKVTVDVLEKLSKTARERTGTDWLMQIESPNRQGNQRSCIAIQFRTAIKSFAKVANVPLMPDGSEWIFTPHQLRRAYAVYFYHGNRYGSLDALSRFFRHFDPEVTRRYIDDEVGGTLSRLREIMAARVKLCEERENQARCWGTSEAREVAQEARRAIAEVKDAIKSVKSRQADFEAERQGSLVSRMLEIFDGLEAPIGRGAAQLYDDLEALITDARRNVRIGGRSNVPPDEERESLKRQLLKYAEDHYLEPIPGEHAHCRCQVSCKDDLAHANCYIGNGNRPDVARATILTCLDCAHFVGFSENKCVIDNVTAKKQEAAECAATGGQRVAAESWLAKAKAARKRASDAVRGKSRIP